MLDSCICEQTWEGMGINSVSMPATLCLWGLGFQLTLPWGLSLHLWGRVGFQTESVIIGAAPFCLTPAVLMHVASFQRPFLL